MVRLERSSGGQGSAEGRRDSIALAREMAGVHLGGSAKAVALGTLRRLALERIRAPLWSSGPEDGADTNRFAHGVTRFMRPSIWGSAARAIAREILVRGLDQAFANRARLSGNETPARLCGRFVIENPVLAYDLKLGLLSVSTSGSGTHVRSLYVFPLRVTPFAKGRLYRSMSP